MRCSRHDRGINLGGDGVRVRPVNGLTLLFGDIMAAKKRPAARRKAVAVRSADPSSTVALAARNLVNMAVVMATCATILLVLMIVKRF